MRSYSIISLFLFSSFINLNGQSITKIDSLRNLSGRTSNESRKANLYLDISDEYWSNNPDKCREYAIEAYKIGEKIKSHSILYKAFKNLGAAFSFKGNYTEALHYDLKSIDEAKILKNDTLLCKAYIGLGSDYTALGKFDSADIMLDQGILIARKYKFQEILCELYINKGNNQYYNSRLIEAERSFNEGLKLAITIKDENNMVILYNNIAAIRLYRGLSDSTVLTYIMQSIRINEKNKQFSQLVDNYTTLASAYNLQKDYAKTVLYLKKAYWVSIQIKSEAKAVPALCSLADVYREMNQLDSAAKYADLAIQLGVPGGYSRGLASAYSVKGYILGEQGKYMNAEKLLHRAFTEFKEMQALEGILYSGNQLANVLAKQKKYKESNAIASYIFHLARENKDLQAIKNSATVLSLNSYNARSYKKAFEYLKIVSDISDSLSQEQNKTLLNEMESKYQAEKKNDEIKILNLTNTQQKTQIAEQKASQLRVVVIFISVILLLILLGTLFYWGIQNRKKRERALLNLKIRESEQVALRSQMNPHFIFNCVQTIERLLNNQKTDVAKMCLYQFSNLTRSVLENSTKPEITLEEELDTLKLYMELEKFRFQRPFEYYIINESDLDLKTTLIPPLILQPFVENSIKHGFKDDDTAGILKISLAGDGEYLVCVLEDNGIGRVESQKLKTTSAFKKESLGLKLTEDRLNLLSAMKKRRSFYRIEDLLGNNDSSGTKVLIYLPFFQSI
jgi:two-component sensor histidine kinase